MIANNASYVVAFEFAKITKLPMLRLRRGKPSQYYAGVIEMSIVEKTFSLAAALGASALAFALTLA